MPSPHRSPYAALLSACVLSAALHALVLGSAGFPRPSALPAAALSRALKAELVSQPARQTSGAETAPDRERVADARSGEERSAALVPMPRGAAPEGVRLPSEAPRAARENPPSVFVSDPIYYATRDLDVYPVPRTRLKLGALDALGASNAGRARLELHIDQAGAVQRVDVLEAQSVLAAEAAKRAFAATRFTPALKDGKPVRSRVLVEVTFGTHRAGTPQPSKDAEATAAQAGDE